jgi:hypothetical protein
MLANDNKVIDSVLAVEVGELTRLLYLVDTLFVAASVQYPRRQSILSTLKVHSMIPVHSFTVRVRFEYSSV